MFRPMRVERDTDSSDPVPVEDNRDVRPVIEPLRAIQDRNALDLRQRQSLLLELPVKTCDFSSEECDGTAEQLDGSVLIR